MSNKQQEVWVFAYGSLIWNPGFEFCKFLIGHIKGYSRRFYQGSDQHRGSSEWLGRVATLVEDEQGSTWGIAYLIKDEETALKYLKQRESSIGGYTTLSVKFYPKNSKENPINTLVYIALPNNRLFLGPSSMPKIANDIAFARGFCGHNVEYLSKLVAFMKIDLPDVHDEHLIQLELEVKRILERSNPSLLKLFREAINSWLTNTLFIEEPSEDNDEDYDGPQQNDETDSSKLFLKQIPFIDTLPGPLFHYLDK